MATSTGSRSPLATYSGSIGEGHGCGASFVGLVVGQSDDTWSSVVVWVDTATRQAVRRALPQTQRLLGASPRGYVVADSTTSTTVEVVGNTGARRDIAPLADSWGCDAAGYAWTEFQPGAWTERAYQRSWSSVDAPATLVATSERELRVLSVSGGAALLSDSHRNGYTTRPETVTLVRAVAGNAPAVLWSGSDAVIEGAVASGTATYLRVTDRSSGAAVNRTFVRDAGGSVTSVNLSVPAPSSATPLASTGAGSAAVGVAGPTGGLFALTGTTVIRKASWSHVTARVRGG